MAYRTLRQRILTTSDAKFFSDSYVREGLLSEDQWVNWCTEDQGHCILGSFVNAELVGIIMMTRQGGPDSPVVEWEAAWLDPRYRGTGAGKLAYEHALQWSQRQGYEFAVGFIRATYTPALDICRTLSFVYVYTIPNEHWADGTTSDTQAFLLDLRPQAATFASLPPLERFDAALSYLALSAHPPPTSGVPLAA
jgi:GNAT superfamily N-acetyltransferase